MLQVTLVYSAQEVVHAGEAEKGDGDHEHTHVKMIHYVVGENGEGSC